MRRHRYRGFGASVVAGALAAVTLGLAGPSFADTTSPTDPPATTTSPGPTGPEQTAQWQAMQTGQPVVVDALTTQTSQTVAEPDGSFKSTSSVAPVRVQKNSAWVDVDATLSQNADGTYSPQATPSGVALSGGGTGPLATLTDRAGHLLSYTLPFTLPAPTVTGDSALYPDVLPGVDLKATVDDQGGFGETLIVHDAAAAADPALASLTLTTVTQGLTLASDQAGNITAKAGDGTPVFTSPAPLMWDSSTQAAPQPSAATSAAGAADTGTDTVQVSTADSPGPGAQVEPVGVATAPGSVTLSPDKSLLTGSATIYPVFIDPWTSPHSLQTSHYTVTFENSGCRTSQWDTPQDKGEGVGYQHYATSCSGLERTFYQFDTSYLTSSMQVSKATLVAAETYGSDGDCNKTWPVTAKVTGAISGSTLWPGPSPTSTIGTAYLKSNHGCNGTQYADFSVTSYIAALTQATSNDTWTVGLFGDEGKYSTNYGFMRFAINPSIVVEFDIAPDEPSGAYTTPDARHPDGSSAGAACPTGEMGWIGRTTLQGGNSNITLSATLKSPMSGATLFGRFKVWDNQTEAPGGGSTWSTPANSASVASGEAAHTNIGIAVKDGHQYGWSVTADDTHHTGPTLTGCHFIVDLSPPEVAITASTAFPPLGSGLSPTAHAGQTGLTVHVSATDPTPTDCTLSTCLKSGVQRFEYSMDSPIPPSGGAVAPGFTRGSDGSATADVPISVTAQQWGTHTLYVQAVDGAGNARPTAYRFYAPWNPDDTLHAHAGDLTFDGVPDALTADSGGNLELIRGNTGRNSDPETASPAADAPDCSTDNTACHPDRPGWSNILVTHRGSYIGGNVDDLLAYSKNNGKMYLYLNDAYALATSDPQKPITAGHFTHPEDVQPLTAKPDCVPLDASGTGCAGYAPTSWSSLTQMIAVGNPDDPDGPSDLVTVENGHLWFYAGSTRRNSFLSSARLLGTGDWSRTTLVAPGEINGTLALWVRDDVTGLIHDYPISLDGDKLPATEIVPPARTPLVAGVTSSAGTALCADIAYSSAGDGTPVQADECNGSTAQNWTLGTDGSVRALGKCLDAASAGTSPNTPIQLYTCNGTAAQKWTPGANNTLTNPVSGLCLTSAGTGMQLVLQGCASAGAPDQAWTRDTTGTPLAQQDVLPLNVNPVKYPTVLSPGDANAPSTAGSYAPDGYPDLYVIDNAGRITEYPGAPETSGVPQFAAPVQVGYTVQPPVMPDIAGDLNGDGTPDLLAIDTDGDLRFYADSGNGRPADGSGIDLGGGWAGALVSHRGDWTGDGREDIIARLGGRSDLWLYPGSGSGGFTQRASISRPASGSACSGTTPYDTDWSAVTQVVSAGDVTGDGLPDLLTVEHGCLYLFPGTGDGQVSTATLIGNGGWSTMDIMAPGDVNADGLSDLWARNRNNGDIVQYLNDASGQTAPGRILGAGSRAVTIATGFTSAGIHALAAAGDANGDGHPDLWATWASDDHLHFYPGTGRISPGFGSYTDVSGGGWTTSIVDIA